MNIGSATATQATLSAAMNNNGVNKMDQAARALSNVDPKEQARVKEAAKDFEAVFITQMLSHMFSGLDVDPMFGGGQGEEMFRSMMVEEYGKQMAEQGGMGIADHVQAKLIEMQASGF